VEQSLSENLREPVTRLDSPVFSLNKNPSPHCLVDQKFERERVEKVVAPARSIGSIPSTIVELNLVGKFLVVLSY
jgi:hypothetical protein